MNTNSRTITITRISFYALWLVVSLLQAYHTELLADEAYYWKYAQELAWGYFDHPPMVAVLIKPGYLLLQNELGVRLLFILSGTLFIYLLELLARPQKPLLFYLSAASVGAFHFIGFLALPDMPLLLFTASFLLLFRQYLQQDKLYIALLLALNVALLLLSKYHGILVIGFAVLSQLYILKRKTSWLIVLISFLLFLPHILWQVNNGMPSVKYHLSERSAEPYRVDFTLNYLLSALLMFSPVTAIVLAWHGLRLRTRKGFESTLKTVFIGTLLFFFLMTFKGRSEANWIAPALVPAFVLGYRACEDKSWFPRFVRTGFIISIVLIVAARIFFAHDMLPQDKKYVLLREHFYHNKEWAEAIQEYAGDRPVVFMNKYQYAARYEFYTGMPAISLNNRMGRKNQYNIWSDEQQIQGREIMLVPNYVIPGMDSFNTPKGVFQYSYIGNFRSASQVTVIPAERQFAVHPGEAYTVPFRIKADTITWAPEANSGLLPELHGLVFKHGKLAQDERTGFYINKEMTAENSYTVTLNAPAEPGMYSLYIDIAMGWLPPAINSNKITLEVK